MVADSVNFLWDVIWWFFFLTWLLVILQGFGIIDVLYKWLKEMKGFKAKR